MLDLLFQLFCLVSTYINYTMLWHTDGDLVLTLNKKHLYNGKFSTFLRHSRLLVGRRRRMDPLFPRDMILRDKKTGLQNQYMAVSNSENPMFVLASALTMNYT